MKKTCEFHKGHAECFKEFQKEVTALGCRIIFERDILHMADRSKTLEKGRIYQNARKGILLSVDMQEPL